MDKPPDDSYGSKKTDRSLQDFFKRALLSGADALVTTEDGIRSYLSNQMAKSKEDLSKILSQELREFLQTTDLAAVCKKVLSSISLEINATVRFIDESDSLKPKADVKVRVKDVQRAPSRKPRSK
jgi:hypothetical protein